jgi:hypothetical protein
MTVGTRVRLLCDAMLIPAGAVGTIIGKAMGEGRDWRVSFDDYYTLDVSVDDLEYA